MLHALIAAVLLGVVLGVARFVFKLLMATRWARRRMIRHTFDQVAKLTTPEGSEVLRSFVLEVQEDVEKGLSASKLAAGLPGRTTDPAPSNSLSNKPNGILRNGAAPD